MTKHNPKRWREYYKATETADVKNFLLRSALRSSSRRMPRTAIDLGCGYGADSKALLKEGYEVYAIDAQPQAIKHLRKSIRPTWRRRVHTKVARFEELRKTNLPRVSLINASYSLFFCAPSSFERLWESLCGSLDEGGIFVGHFIGPKDDWVGRRGITAVSRHRLTKTLLKDFRILRLKEEQNDEGTITGRAKHWHLFSVIARKLS